MLELVLQRLSILGGRSNGTCDAGGIHYSCAWPVEKGDDTKRAKRNDIHEIQC